MSEPEKASEHLSQYLRQLPPQVRSRLLAELERLHLLGEDIPHTEAMMAALRAEFRSTGERHYRLGNPARYFFEPLEPVLVNVAPERANSGQIARGSLGPIWSLVTEKVLPSMAADYVASAKQVIIADRPQEARRIAAAFQRKVMTYLDGVLGSADGEATIRAGLETYTSSHATFDDLMKMLRMLHAQHDLSDFSHALPAKIGQFEGEAFAKAVHALDVLKSKRADAVPFALTIIARRLEIPWQLYRLAMTPAGSKAASRIAATSYAMAVGMVLDQIDERHALLQDALRHNHVLKAKEIVGEIYAIERTLTTQIDLDGSDWRKRLTSMMAAVKATLDSEISSIPTDHLHLWHVLESPSLRQKNFLSGRLSHMVRRVLRMSRSAAGQLVRRRMSPKALQATPLAMACLSRLRPYAADRDGPR